MFKENIVKKLLAQPKFKRSPRLSDQVANYLVSEIRKGSLRLGLALFDLG